MWPLSQAAEACFGTSSWPADRPVPQSRIAFEVADIGSVGAAARVQTAEGVIVGISYAPWMHGESTTG